MPVNIIILEELLDECLCRELLIERKYMFGCFLDTFLKTFFSDSCNISPQV